MSYQTNGSTNGPWANWIPQGGTNNQITNSGFAYPARRDCGLGTAQVMTDATGLIQQESDYYPFGGERVITNTVDNRYKFTGKERDVESGLDHSPFRQYSSNLGRWLSPDPKRGKVGNPQSLNRYAYALNNACSATDPLGLIPYVPASVNGWDEFSLAAIPVYSGEAVTPEGWVVGTNQVGWASNYFNWSPGSGSPTGGGGGVGVVVLPLFASQVQQMLSTGLRQR